MRAMSGRASITTRGRKSWGVAFTVDDHQARDAELNSFQIADRSRPPAHLRATFTAACFAAKVIDARVLQNLRIIRTHMQAT
jgi:hypothetical protein